MHSEKLDMAAPLNRTTASVVVRLGFVLTVLLLCACSTVGPDFVKPSAPVEKEWIEAEDPGIKPESVDHSAWWKVFNDPVLDNLIEIASEQNLPLHIAGLRILQARANLGIAIGLQYPQSQLLNGGFSFMESSKNAPPLSNFPENVKSGLDTSTYSYQLGLGAAWEVDFWGKFRRGVEASEASLAASLAGYDSLLVMLTGEVAAAYVVIRTVEDRIKIVRGNIVVQKRALRIAEAQFKGGEVSELDVAQARALLHNTQSLIPVLEISLRQAKNGLSVLLGMPPSDLQEVLKGPALIPTAPRDVAVGIPADLLRRRPDIRQAEFQAIAQGALIGVAKADLYPHFGIGGAIGYSAGDGANLFTANSFTGFFTPFTFSWDIFNYGRIKNNVRAQDALFEQMLVNYQNAVLNAAKEVEDALVGFLRSKDQVGFLTDAVKASQRAVDLALLQYKEGIVDYTRVLNTQQSLLLQQENLVISQGDLPRYLIGVYKALGGGWQIRQGKDIIPEKTLKVMRERTDWGNLLPGKPLPEELKQPPTGKEVGLFNKPEW